MVLWAITVLLAAAWLGGLAPPQALLAAALAALLLEDVLLLRAVRRERSLRRSLAGMERAAAGLVAESRAREERALADPLTGLGNRRRLDDAVAAGLAQVAVSGRPFSLILLDIDHFKSYNDTHGHPAGDALLRALAGVLRAVFRAEDVLCRYGGEEFAAVLPGAGPEQALEAAERLRAAVERHRFPGGETQPGGRVTISVGVASCPDDGMTAQDVLEAADRALYRAKREGRNRVAGRPAAS